MSLLFSSLNNALNGKIGQAAGSSPLGMIGGTATPQVAGSGNTIQATGQFAPYNPTGSNSFTPPTTPSLSGFTSQGQAIPATSNGGIQGLNSNGGSGSSQYGPTQPTSSTQSQPATPTTSPTSTTIPTNSSQNNNGMVMSPGGQYVPAGTTSTQTDPSQTYSTGLNSQINYGTGSGNTNVNTATTGLLGQSTNTPQATAQGGLQGIATAGSPAVQNAIQNIQGLQNTQNEIATNPNVAAEVASGRGQAITGEINAAQTGLQNQLAQQSQQISAGNDAGSLANTNQSTQVTAGSNAGQVAQNQQNAQIGAVGNATGQAAPVAGANYFSSPTSGGIVGSGANGTGGSVGMTGNSVIDNTVSTAVNQILSGSDADTALANVKSLNNPQAINNVIAQMRQYDPNWTIGSSNAVAQQNYKQVQSYMSQGSDLSNGLQNLDKAAQTAQNFLQSEPNINPTPVSNLNKGIDTFEAQFKNPADFNTYQAIIGDIGKYQSQILSSNSGITPTGNTATILKTDPSLLSASQLPAFMSELAKIGGNQLSTLQTQIQDIMGSGTSAYAGSTAQTDTSPSYAPNNSTSGVGGGGAAISNPYIQGAFGTGMNAMGDIAGLAQHVLLSL